MTGFLPKAKMAIEKEREVPHGTRLVLGLADREEESFCFVECGCSLGLRDAKLLFGKDGFRLGASILEWDNPYIRYLDPLASGSEGDT